MSLHILANHSFKLWCVTIKLQLCI